MAVFRVHKDANYTVMANYHLRDRMLSLKGKGLMSFFLSLPESWTYSIRGLEKVLKENRTAISGSINELIQLGYVKRRQTREENGKLSHIVYDIYEKPEKEGRPDILKPQSENLNAVHPDTACPDAGNTPQIITQEKGTKSNNKTNNRFMDASEMEKWHPDYSCEEGESY